MKYGILALAAVALAGFSAQARADIQLTDSGDATVDFGAATTNFGTSPVLAYSGNPDGTFRSKIGFMQFDLSGINLAAITSASLKVSWGTVGADSMTNPTAGNAYTAPQLPMIFGLNLGTSAWTETGITFNNAPGIDTAAPKTGALPGSTTQLGVIYPTSGVSGVTLATGAVLTLRASFSDANPNGLGLLNFLQTQTDANGKVSLLVQEGLIGSGRELNSRENVGGFLPPTLVLTGVDAAPEPTTLGVLALGGSMLLLRRRVRS